MQRNFTSCVWNLVFVYKQCWPPYLAPSASLTIKTLPDQCKASVVLSIQALAQLITVQIQQQFSPALLSLLLSYLGYCIILGLFYKQTIILLHEIIVWIRDIMIELYILNLCIFIVPVQKASGLFLEQGPKSNPGEVPAFVPCMLSEGELYPFSWPYQIVDHVQSLYYLLHC